MKHVPAGRLEITHAVIMDTNTNASELMTETELIEFLRIPLVSKAGNHGHVIEHLKRMRGLPCIHICRQPLYPRAAVLEWIHRETGKDGRK